MGVKSKKEAVNRLIADLDILNQLTVQGRDNCCIVVACGNDIQAVINFLQTDESETPEEQEKES